MVVRSRGEFARGRGYLEQAAESVPGDPRITMLLALHEFETGDSGRAAELAQTFLETEAPFRTYPTSYYAISALATMYRLSGSDAFAERARAIHEGMEQKGPVELYHDSVTTGLALIAATDGDVTRCTSYYRILRRCPRKMCGGLLISSDRLLGLLCQGSGRSLRAHYHFRKAIRFCEGRFLPELAWSMHDYSVFLLHSGATRHRKQIADLRDQSWNLAKDLGMAHLEKQSAEIFSNPEQLT
jgi:hypothetical protein